MENSLDACVLVYGACMWMGTLVELELKNPVGLLHVEQQFCEDCSVTASNGAFLK